MKNIFKISTLSIITILALSSCGGGSSTSATTNTKQGYFIDSGVEGLDYKATPSGKTGITDKDGLFDYVDGDTVKFSVGNFELGEAKPTQDGLVTPEAIIPEDMTEEARTEAEGLMLRVLQSIDIDNDASNGIEIPEAEPPRCIAPQVRMRRSGAKRSEVRAKRGFPLQPGLGGGEVAQATRRPNPGGQPRAFERDASACERPAQPRVNLARL
jgi:hypothetical protein